MEKWKQLLLPGALACIIIAGVAIALIVRHFSTERQANAVPGLSIAGATPCQDFLAETQLGTPAVVSHDGKVMEQDVRAYVSSPAVAIAHMWYFDCGQRMFYYVELTGTFAGNAFSYPAGASPPSASHEYLLFDAKTGNVLRISFGN